MLRIGVCLLWSMAAIIVGQVCYGEPIPIERLALNGVWRFTLLPAESPRPDFPFQRPDYDDSSWKPIQVPGNWNMAGVEDPHYGRPAGSTGLYRTTFRVPGRWKDYRVFMRFEGVLFNYEFHVNGSRVGDWDSAFNPKQFDITSHVSLDKPNTLAVRVNNRGRVYEFDTNDDWGLSGIYRDVELLAIPRVHIAGIRVVTRVSRDLKTARVEVSTTVGTFDQERGPVGCAVAGVLRDASGKLVGRFDSVVGSDGKVSAMMLARSPRLWTAETPYLYTLSVTLRRGSHVIQTVQERVGIREVAIENGVLLLNWRPVKLKGVNRHESDPVVGKALREEHWLKDIDMMKAAHINFVRTSHYPPHPRFIELCDRHGLYVCCEVPFGYGDSLLEDPSCQDDLYRRAEATLERDRNRPSVIMWSVGNENPWTPLVENTVRRVKELDPTRPTCVPMTNGKFVEVAASLPRCVDILAPHYPTPKQLDDWAAKFDRPIVATEYSHSLGLAMEQLSACWQVMEKRPRIAGGAIWHWCDQGVLRRSANPRIPEHPDECWIDRSTYIDCAGDSGTDGIVYADRNPQVDYWQVRKVYSPILIAESAVSAEPGARSVSLSVHNRFDSTDLASIGAVYRWRFYEDAAVKGSGQGRLGLPPGESAAISIALPVALESDDRDRRLRIEFVDGRKRPIYEHTVRLLVGGKTPHIASRLEVPPRPVRRETSDGIERLTSGDVVVERSTDTGSLTVRVGGAPVVADGPFARVGRLPSMAEKTIKDKFPATDTFWNPYMLNAARVSDFATSSDGQAVSLGANCRFDRADVPGQSVSGRIETIVRPGGIVDVAYDLAPSDATGVFLEAGISFRLPRDLTEIRWLGGGPYASYPGNGELAERGVHATSAADLSFGGNREGVDLVAVTDKQGRGIGIVCDSANIAWERSARGIMMSHNAMVAGRGNKRAPSAFRIPASNVKRIAGSFRLVPLSPSHWPELFSDFFGAAKPSEFPAFAPYIASYDN